MSEWLLFISAITLGLLSGGHCIGMCGGLMGAFSFALPTDKPSKRIALIITYNIGRITSYALAGLILGLVGASVANSSAGHILRFLAGLLLIAMGLYLTNWWTGLTYLEKLGHKIWRYIHPFTKYFLPVSNYPRAFFLGFLWGWLPCGLVYSTLLWSSSQNNALLSALLMFGFGIGTLPVLIAAGLASKSINHFFRKKSVRTIAGISIILFGLWTLPGVHQHLFM